MSKAEEKKQKEYRKILEGLLKLPENKQCADCAAAAPRWASATLGVFLCMKCAGIHRAMGTHISFIRSVTLDVWNSEQIETMQKVGNGRASAIYEGRVPKHCPRPNPGDNIALDKWIRDKYEIRRFYKEPTAETFNQPPPPPKNSTSNGANRPKDSESFGFENIRPKPAPLISPTPVDSSVVLKQPPSLLSPNLLDPTPPPPPQQLTKPNPIPTLAPSVPQQPSTVKHNIMSQFDQPVQYPHNQYYSQPGTPYYHMQSNQYTNGHHSQTAPHNHQHTAHVQHHLQPHHLSHNSNPQHHSGHPNHFSAPPSPHVGNFHSHYQTGPADDLLLKINNMGQERRRQEFAVFNS